MHWETVYEDYGNHITLIRILREKGMGNSRVAHLYRHTNTEGKTTHYSASIFMKGLEKVIDTPKKSFIGVKIFIEKMFRSI